MPNLRSLYLEPKNLSSPNKLLFRCQLFCIGFFFFTISYTHFSCFWFPRRCEPSSPLLGSDQPPHHHHHPLLPPPGSSPQFHHQWTPTSSSASSRCSTATVTGESRRRSSTTPWRIWAFSFPTRSLP